MQKCSAFEKCGGCSKLNISYNEQLKIKEKSVLSLFDQYQIKSNNYHGITPSVDIYGYRNKMEYSFGNEYKDGPLVLGLRGKGKKFDVYYTKDCKLVDDDFNNIVMKTREFFLKKNIPFRNYKNHSGFLRNLGIRKGLKTGEILLNLVTSLDNNYYQEIETWKEEMLNTNLKGNIVSIIQSKTESKANVVKADEMEILYGRNYFYEKILDLTFKIGPFSFFQTNTKRCRIRWPFNRIFFCRHTLSNDARGFRSGRHDRLRSLYQFNSTFNAGCDCVHIPPQLFLSEWESAENMP
ncbi:MAG: RNA methyltransferase, TrmA family [Petrotoga mobilis]|nr:MAG: RNA methyltransferase, TrmA family [Petrotoga mobilis]